MPVRYSSDLAEHQAVREGVGVFDISHMAEFFVSGEAASEGVSWGAAASSGEDACGGVCDEFRQAAQDFDDGLFAHPSARIGFGGCNRGIERRLRPTTKPDWDNIAKVIDALNHVVWADDASVVDGLVRKFYGETPELVIQVTALEPQAVRTAA